MKNGIFSIAVCLSAAVSVPAMGHVVLTEKTGVANSYHAAFFRVGHGCQDQATTALTVHIPASLSVRPQPKAGWDIATAQAENGIAAVTWTGRLPADQFDDFGLLMKLPAEAQDLPFRVTQTCGDRISEWDGHAPAFPQPVLSVLPAAPQPPVTHPHGEH